MAPFIEITAGRLHLLGTYVLPLQVVLLVLLLLLATAVDLRERRIPNWLVAWGIIIALAFHVFAYEGKGAVFALSGLGVGMAMLFPMYALRVMGAGDVKLMGMIGTFLGGASVLGAVLASMVAGGILAIATAAGKRMLPQMFTNLGDIVRQFHIKQIIGPGVSPMPSVASVGKMPYAIAITVGTLIQLTILRY
jgi:prepilin peptidase CpaA